MNGKWISGNAGQIFNNQKDLIEYGIKSKGAAKNIMQFDTLKEAENCKISLNNNVLYWNYIFYSFDWDWKPIYHIKFILLVKKEKKYILFIKNK